jgi:hypothetical protein
MRGYWRVVCTTVRELVNIRLVYIPLSRHTPPTHLQLNAQKHAMVDSNYERVPSWLRLFLPRQLFLNLAAVKGSPQHRHFSDGSESYMHFQLIGSGAACV